MKKIGVYDSGMGGLSLLARLVRDLPGYDYIYFGDSANAPYGIKTKEEILNLARSAVNRLIDQGCQAVVIACNTASSAAEEILRQEFDIPIFGMEPALDIAIEDSPEGKLVVMATNFTLSNPRFTQLALSYKSQRDIISLPGPRLVLLVEEGVTRGERIQKELLRMTSDLDLNDLSGVVLGCTHFLFLEKEIQDFFGSQVKIYDSHGQTVDRIRESFGPGQADTNYRFISSAGKQIEENFKCMMENYLQDLD